MVIIILILQGSYLGELLSNTNGEIAKESVDELEKKRIKPFTYRHLGSFAYVGDNKAVLQLPLIGKINTKTNNYKLQHCRLEWRRGTEYIHYK